jgi:hypothetical protein
MIRRQKYKQNCDDYFVASETKNAQTVSWKERHRPVT